MSGRYRLDEVTGDDDHVIMYKGHISRGPFLKSKTVDVFVITSLSRGDEHYGIGRTPSAALKDYEKRWGEWADDFNQEIRENGCPNMDDCAGFRD